ncbi:riboflavin synthase [soil metagenome]
MFTGIIEAVGTIQKISEKNGNRTFLVKSPLSKDFRIDESISHDGVCLTIENIENDIHQVTAISETLKKKVLVKWKTGTTVNIERSLRMNDRLTGHIVQGHVDTTARCVRKLVKAGSIEFTFHFNEQYAKLLIEKGSVCINGISLTAFNAGKDHFNVAIIPFTFEHTNMKFLEESMAVNIEFDLIGKYINRIHEIDG